MKRWRHIHSSKLNTEETSLVRPSVAASASRSLACYQPSSSEHSRSINNNRCQGRIVRIFRYKYQIFAFLTLSRAWRGLEAHFNSLPHADVLFVFLNLNCHDRTTEFVAQLWGFSVQNVRYISLPCSKSTK